MVRTRAAEAARAAKAARRVPQQGMARAVCKVFTDYRQKAQNLALELAVRGVAGVPGSVPDGMKTVRSSPPSGGVLSLSSLIILPIRK